ncbi:MAG: DUF3833 domain-containing protein [Gammaproteobacteria bacterium]|nr:DUF3833 domain-containing protein [Gammaproteobacteria bacterium]
MKLESVAGAAPEFDFTEYFAGHTKASGWFADRFGNIKRHFCGDFFGSWDDQVFVLDEVLYYTDGVVEKRQWRVTFGEDGSFSADSDSLVGSATGKTMGNTLALSYVMKVAVAENKEWVLSMDDWMIYQPDGSLHNQTNVYKWGFRIGTVTTQYTPHDGEMLCHDAIDVRKAG